MNNSNMDELNKNHRGDNLSVQGFKGSRNQGGRHSILKTLSILVFFKVYTVSLLKRRDYGRRTFSRRT